MMRASRTSYESVVTHRRSAEMVLDVLDAAERFAVSAMPRPAVRGVKAERKDRPARRARWFNSKGKRS